MKQFKFIIQSMRIRQWPKNIFIFAALIFDRQLTEWKPFAVTAAAFILFCFVSSVVYIINDIADIETDRQHPEKQNRPLASGKLSTSAAVIAAVLLIVLVIPASFILNRAFGIILSTYLTMMIAYSFWLKHLPLIDVMIIAAGFVLRVAAGVVIIQTQMFSPWLFVATTFLALFIALGKRRAEVHLLESEAGSHRKVLDGYTLELLDQLLTVVLSITLMTYCLYTFSASLAPNNYGMMLTIPFVIYALFRYLYLIKIIHIGGAPEEIVLTDRPMQISILLWGLTVILILYIL
jgi:4-hydroxybenzoate polyprenyltransferase